MRIVYLKDLDKPNQYSGNDAILFRYEDKEYLDDVIGGVGFPTPHSFWQLSPNVKDTEIGTLQYYVKYCLKSEIIELCDITVECRSNDIASFFNAWDQVVDSINKTKVSTDEILRKVEFLLGNIPGFLEECRSYIDFIGLYVKTVIEPIYLSGPFRDATFGDKTELWYREEPSISCDYMVDAAVNLDHKIIYKELIEYSKKTIKKYQTTTLTPKDAIYNYSCYFGFLANVYCSNAFYTLSVIYSHRSLDLFFLSKAWSEGLITEEKDRLRYTLPNNINDYITLLNSERQLIDAAKLTRDRKRGEFIRWLNRTRNFFMITHGMYSCSEFDANKSLRKMETITRAVEGNNRWKTLVANMKPVTIQHKYLFETIGSIDTYCERVG